MTTAFFYLSRQLAGSSFSVVPVLECAQAHIGIGKAIAAENGDDVNGAVLEHWISTGVGNGKLSLTEIRSHDDKIVGLVAATANDSQKGNATIGVVDMLWTAPVIRRRRLGSKLLNAALLNLKAAGDEAAMLYVGRINKAAQRFYENNGWQANHEGLTHITYTRPLSQLPNSVCQGRHV